MSFLYRSSSRAIPIVLHFAACRVFLLRVPGTGKEVDLDQGFFLVAVAVPACAVRRCPGPGRTTCSNAVFARRRYTGGRCGPPGCTWGKRASRWRHRSASPWKAVPPGDSCCWPHVLVHAVDPLDDDLVSRGKRTQHLGEPALFGISPVVAGNHFNLVVFTNMHGRLTSLHFALFLDCQVPVWRSTQCSDRGPRPGRGQTTSAARLMIFMNWRSRSSRAIAPKMRVPRGFLSASISTTALRSNLM